MWAKEISEGGHMGTTTHQGAPGGPGALRWVVPTWCTSLRYYLHKKFLNIQKKNRINFSEHSDNFYFWVIFYCTGNSDNRLNMAFYFI